MVVRIRHPPLAHARLSELGDGTPQELYFQPRTVFAADFLGESNLMPATVRESSTGETLVGASDGVTVRGQPNPALSQGDGVRFMVRPESVKLVEPGGADNEVEGVLKEVIMSGQITKCFMELPDGTEMVSTRLTVEGGTGMEPGHTVRFGWSADHTVVLPDGGEA